MSVGQMKYGVRTIAGALAIAICTFGGIAQAQVERFVGSYVGSASLIMADGTTQPRDMSVEIIDTEEGFTVRWTSVTYRTDGSTKAKSYTVNFEPSDREGIFAAAMSRNVFGHDVQLNPMKGEPYVWARIEGDTLSVFSLYVTDTGGYDIQQFDRTIVDGGLQLHFKSLTDGAVTRKVSTFLTRE